MKDQPVVGVAEERGWGDFLELEFDVERGLALRKSGEIADSKIWVSTAIVGSP